MIFGAFCTAMGIHVFLMWPETRQMSLEEIDILFDGKVPAWRSSTVKSRFDEEVEELRRQWVENPSSTQEHYDGSSLQREDTLVQGEQRKTKEEV